MRVVSRLRRACFIAAGVLVATAAVVPVVAKAAPSDPDADRPIAWYGNAVASGVHAEADRKEQLLPLQHPFFGSFPDAASSWDAGGVYARGSIYFPGEPEPTTPVPRVQ